MFSDLLACSWDLAASVPGIPLHIGRPCLRPLPRGLGAGGRSSTLAPGNNDLLLECRSCPDRRMVPAHCPVGFHRPWPSKDSARCKLGSWRQIKTPGQVAMGARESKMLQSESSEVAGSHKTGNTRPLLILKIFWHMCRVRALCRLEPLGNNAACVGLHEQGCAKFRLK